MKVALYKLYYALSHTSRQQAQREADMPCILTRWRDQSGDFQIRQCSDIILHSWSLYLRSWSWERHNKFETEIKQDIYGEGTLRFAIKGVSFRQKCLVLLSHILCFDTKIVPLLFFSYLADGAVIHSVAMAKGSWATSLIGDSGGSVKLNKTLLLDLRVY